jgi:uncharacterized caspase-like protein
MPLDRRFAIVVGINDYSKKPLNYCASDASAVAGMLIKRCGFREQDIYPIISDNQNPIKDITGRFDTALQAIKTEFVEEEDSLFFFFAGHGGYFNDQSMMSFQDSQVSIFSIFERLNQLVPKYQCYVVDACESGGKVLARSLKDKSIFSDFVASSSGVTLMYAATTSEVASEDSSLGHGVFTNYFLKVLDDEQLYDEDGILTPGRLQEQVSRATIKETQFSQTPVVENRSTGYYPFAFKLEHVSSLLPSARSAEATSDVASEAESLPDDTAATPSAISQVYFPAIPQQIRELSLIELRAQLPELLSQAPELNREGYSVTQGTDLSIFSSRIASALTDSIVAKSRSEKVEAIDSLFSTDRREKKPNFVTTSLLDLMIQQTEPQYSYINNIRWESNSLIAHTVLLQSSSVYQVSCGLVVIVYQSVYGLGLASSTFYLDYTGSSETQLAGPHTTIKAFKIQPDLSAAITTATQSVVTAFAQSVDKWNTARRNDIAAFDRKSR